MSFTITKNNVQFEFITECLFNQTEEEIVAEVTNDAPIPEILPKDRLILPAGEGIAINVDEEYESGEFSCDLIEGDFCNGHSGSMSMILLERNKIFLAICPDDPVNTQYTIKRKTVSIIFLSYVTRNPQYATKRLILCLRRVNGIEKSIIRIVGHF